MEGMMIPQPGMPPPDMSGMMQPQQAFSGTVSVNGQPVEVQNGVAEFGGKKYYVSNDGEIVADEKGNFIGMIQDGVFARGTKEMAAELKAKGILE